MITTMLNSATRGPAEPKTPEEIAAAKQARDTTEMFIREQVMGKRVMISGGQFSEEMLQGILHAVNP